jgi:hypothetical protein
VTLYIGLFREDSEIEGWVMGHYSDFGYFREVVMKHFTPQQLPLLLGASDCEASFPPALLPTLKAELEHLAAHLHALPPVLPTNAFEHNRALWSRAVTLYDCFHNVDGENLLEALISLCEQGITQELTICFQ